MKAEEPRLAEKLAKTNADKLPSVYGTITLEQGETVCTLWWNRFWEIKYFFWYVSGTTYKNFLCIS
jgi:hypothetical protein